MVSKPSSDIQMLFTIPISASWLVFCHPPAKSFLQVSTCPNPSGFTRAAITSAHFSSSPHTLRNHLFFLCLLHSVLYLSQQIFNCSNLIASLSETACLSRLCRAHLDSSASHTVDGQNPKMDYSKCTVCICVDNLWWWVFTSIYGSDSK